MTTKASTTATTENTVKDTRPFAAIIKECYHKKGLKQNNEVFDELVKMGLVPENDKDAATKIKRKVANAMWAVRTPEDTVLTSRSTAGSLRVDTLRQHIIKGLSNNEAWAEMHKQVAEGGELAKQFEAPGKKWIVDTAWRIKKEEAVIDALAKLAEAPVVAETSTNTIPATEAPVPSEKKEEAPKAEAKVNEKKTSEKKTSGKKKNEKKSA